MAIPAELLGGTKIPSDYILARAHKPDEFQGSPEQEAVLQEAIQYMAHVASSHLQQARELLPTQVRTGTNIHLSLCRNVC
jgi:hypothetical protein